MTFVPPPRGFALDRFQQDAVDGIDRGRSVLVAAPTGSGKTVVAEHALDLTVRDGGRAFYTSPIKALANQKFRDFGARYGRDRVGLLTGDNSINPDAAVVVMTTEVLRNMVYVGSAALDGLRWVVLDEVHYLQDRHRGPVWEEVILNVAPEVGLVSLSATVSNLEELRDWLETVRGATDLVVSTERPVPLVEHLAVNRGSGHRSELVPMFVDGAVNPVGAEMDAPARERRRGGGKRHRFRAPRRSRLVPQLRHEELSPVIWFVFSRAGCDDAARQCAEAGLDFTSDEEKDRIDELLEANLAVISANDRTSLDLDAWCDRARRGIASHHAGLIPAVKEAAEAAFVEGLITVVFATETLALGVNMPARTVVIENLSKFNGETHEILTPLQFTQLVGRAGRRGMDDVGHAVVCWSPWVTFAEVTALAGSTDFPLRSAFQPTYNMAANLVHRMSRPDAETTVARSFAQFQVDREAVRTEQKIRRLESRVRTAEADLFCERGDVMEYVRWQQSDDATADADAIIESLRDTRPGDVIGAPGIGHAAVVSTASRKKRGPRLRVVTADAVTRVIDADDLRGPAEIVASIELPQPFAPKDPDFHAAVARTLRAEGLAELTESGHQHPVEGCPDLDRHLDAVEEVDTLTRNLERTRARQDRRQARLVAEFDRVTRLLELRSCIESWTLTEKGQLLTAVHHECDLLVTEALESGLFADLDVGETAAVASFFTWQHRSSQPPPPPRFPTPTVEHAWATVDDLARSLQQAERDHLGQVRTRDADPGFADVAFQWATGADLSAIVDDIDSGGDFVRNVRQLLDLLRQLAASAPDPAVRRRCHAAIAGLDRGVIRAASDLALSEPEAEDAEP